MDNRIGFIFIDGDYDLHPDITYKAYVIARRVKGTALFRVTKDRFGTLSDSNVLPMTGPALLAELYKREKENG